MAIINGTSNNDILTATSNGSDTLSGGLGNDTYIYDYVSILGNDTINDTGGFDIIKFTKGVSLSNVSFSRINNDLILTIAAQGNNGKITIANHYSGSSGYVEQLQFW